MKLSIEIPSSRHFAVSLWRATVSPCIFSFGKLRDIFLWIFKRRALMTCCSSVSRSHGIRAPLTAFGYVCHWLQLYLHNMLNGMATSKYRHCLFQYFSISMIWNSCQHEASNGTNGLILKYYISWYRNILSKPERPHFWYDIRESLLASAISLDRCRCHSGEW